MTMNSTQGRGKELSSGWIARGESLAARGRRPFVFGALLTFFAVYYYRPEDFIPVLNYIPMARIIAIIGVLALIVGMMGGGKAKVPLAIKILWLLFLQMAICVPFAIWRGGAFSTVFEQFSKCVVVAMLISMAVVTVRELRKLLWIQVSAIALVTFFSIMLNHVRDGRLEGIQKGILENPNDLAINIAVTFPVGLAFMLNARGFKKALWALALMFMILGLILTYSRSGLLAFLICIAACVWEFGIKGKRHYIVVVTAVALTVGLGAALSTAHYRARVESIVLGDVEGSGDKGSFEARKALLEKSIMVALTHPIVGVGPGCFALVDQGWIVAHNSYTEVAAEAGIPAFVLFLIAIGAAFKNIARIRKSHQYQEDPEFRLFAQALRAALAAYLVGACFASTEYNLYIYVVVAYTCVMVRITSQPLPDHGQRGEDRSLSKASYDRIARSEPILGR
jgi:O-antigen ligase